MELVTKKRAEQWCYASVQNARRIEGLFDSLSKMSSDRPGMLDLFMRSNFGGLGWSSCLEEVLKTVEMLVLRRLALSRRLSGAPS